MKKRAVSAGVIFAIAAIGASPASAQFGGISGIAKKAQTVKKLSDAKVSEAEERQIGQEVSDKVVETFGVYQDANVTKYVTLVGAVLAQASTRPDIDWQFVVLDTEGVNAFAAPGGFIHVTKGLLGLMKNEAELAGVLGHEITHVTGRHTVNAIFKGNLVEAGSDEFGSGGMAQSLIAKVVEKAYSDILNNRFSRGDENDADEKGVQLASKVGYAPNGLASALNKLIDRNKAVTEPNGMFASHPQMKDRLTNIEKVIKEKKLAATATVEGRYAKNITFDAKPASAIATVAEGSRGLAGGEEKKDEKTADAAKKEEKKPSGGGFLSKLKGGSSSENKQAQNISSGGARGVNPDRDAVGGPNKKRVPVKIGPNDIAEFQKGIA